MPRPDTNSSFRDFGIKKEKCFKRNKTVVYGDLDVYQSLQAMSLK